MDLIVLSLVSGLVGALGAFWINWANQKRIAVDQLLALVHPLAFKCHYYGGKNIQSSELFAEAYSALYVAYVALRAALPFWKRKHLENAWAAYIRVDYYHTIPDDEPIKHFIKGVNQYPHEFVKASGKFITYLRELRGDKARCGRATESAIRSRERD